MAFNLDFGSFLSYKKKSGPDSGRLTLTKIYSNY